MRLLRWRPRSIRGRLLTAITAVLVLILVASAAGTGWAVRHYLYDRAEGRLQVLSQQLTAALKESSGGSAVAVTRLDEVIGPNVGLVAVSSDGRAAFALGLAQTRPQRLVGATADLPAGHVGRLRQPGPWAAVRVLSPGLRLALRQSGPAVEVSSLIVVVDLSDDQATIRRLVAVQFVVGLVSIVVLSGLTVAVVRAGLRPLTELENAVQAVGRGQRPAHDPLPGGSTETAQLAAHIKDAFAARARAENRLRSFVADASHELRTPLSTIAGWVDLYLQGAIRDQPATLAAMERMEADIARMRLLVDELGLLARLDARAPLAQDRVELCQVADEVIEDARVVSAERPIALAASAPVMIIGDADQLRRVLRNVVGNAVQHTPAGTAVTVEVFAQEQRALIRVIDQGPGIDPVHLPHLFERFWRAEESRTRVRGGSGLGLSIVEAVVIAHGGTVSVTSDAGGTTVTIELPRPGAVVQPSANHQAGRGVTVDPAGSDDQ